MEQVQKQPILKIRGEVYTNSQGINKLMQFYKDASQHRDTRIIVDFYNMQWIDANLTALLNALSYRLGKDYNVNFSADFDFLSKNFSVLFRNGFLNHEDYKIADSQETTIPCTHFLPTEEVKFVEYIAEKLMCHRGFQIDSTLKKRIQSDLIEIFQNIPRHARTSDPCFVCGQFYPNKKFFVLTMVDLGVGFLVPIQEFTDGKINTHIDAVRWALSGQSTQIRDPTRELGGLGLEGILDYCNKNKGVFQIYTGTDFWGTDLENTIWQGYRPLQHDFKGSMLNLFFKF